MKKTIKAHPLMIADKIKPFLFVLVLPLLKGLFQYIIKKSVSGVLSLEIAVFIVIALIATAQSLSFSLEILPNRIIIASGVIFKRKSFINIKSVSSISFNRSLIDVWLGAVTCCVNTEAGGVGKEDFKFKLYRKDAETLNRIIYSEEKWEKNRVSPLKIAFWAATTSSAFSGLVIGTPIVNSIGDLLGIAIYSQLFDEINEVSSKFNTYMPPIVNSVTLIFLIAYAVGFIYHFARNLRFSLKTGKSAIKIENGIIFRRSTVFKRKSINNISIEQTFLMRLAKRASMQAYVGGYGNRKDRAVVSPCEKRTLLYKNFNSVFDCFNVKGDSLRPIQSKSSLRRFLWLPALAAITVFLISSILALNFPHFDSFIVFIAALLLAFICYWAELCRFNYKRGRIVLGDNICAIGSKGLKTAEFYCDKTNIGCIKLRQTPADRRLDTCKIKMTVSSENAYGIWVRNISKKVVMERLSQIYEINASE